MLRIPKFYVRLNNVPHAHYRTRCVSYSICLVDLRTWSLDLEDALHSLLPVSAILPIWWERLSFPNLPHQSTDIQVRLHTEL